MEALAWRASSNSNDLLYRLQVNNIDGRTLAKIKKICADWDGIGYGWNKKTRHNLLLFSRTFKNRRAWLKWAKQFPYNLIEFNSNGKPLKKKLGAYYP